METKKLALEELKSLFIDNPVVVFDSAVSVDSLGNSVKEVNGGELIWEDYSDEDIDIENADADDILYLIDEIKEQVYKDDVVMQRCQGLK